MKIDVRQCRFEANRPFDQKKLPLIPQAIAAKILGETKIKIDGVSSCGSFQVRAMVFVVPDGDQLVLSGVGLPRKAPMVQMNPPAEADEPFISVEDLDQCELRLGLCRAINASMESKIGRNFRFVLPGLNVIPLKP